VYAQRTKGGPGPETSSDSSFDPKALTKLAVIVVGEARGREFQTDQQRLVEDEFVQILLTKGYRVVSRSDVQAVMKEQRFQRSGLTEDDAAALGKLLNVPAVMVVRVTEFSTEASSNPRTRARYTTARASMGARLVGVETGTILWMGKHSQSGAVENRTEAPRALSRMAKTIASAFPDQKGPEPKQAAQPQLSRKAQTDFDQAQECEKIKNLDGAILLYGRVVKAVPGTPLAEKASERVTALKKEKDAAASGSKKQ